MKLRDDEYRAVVSAMDEGIIVFDQNGIVVEVNEAAPRLLNTNCVIIPGLAVDELSCDEKLRVLVHKALRLKIPLQEFHLVRASDQESYLKLSIRPLDAPERSKLGVLLVISDLTRLRQLESVRRDFVANVSHELKTPVTSIKGFVETLLDGAMKDPEQAERFLQIVARQADRLNNIFEDLLTLARLEQQEEENLIALHPRSLQPVLACAVQDCERLADDKRIKVSLECERNIILRMNERLLEQAVTNLIGNALKYSEPGDCVKVCAKEKEGEIIISVEDHGCGIGEQHLQRIWERFYRVDQARSRKLGGTGLGLAIVKHIAQVHAGYPSVQSTLGKGSTFAIHIPLREAESEAA